MSAITTHVLDTARGLPAMGIAVLLERADAAAQMQTVARGITDTDGRVRDLYGARSLLPGRTARAVFVIDAQGRVSHRDVRPLGLFRPRDADTIAAVRRAQGARG